MQNAVELEMVLKTSFSTQGLDGLGPDIEICAPSHLPISGQHGLKDHWSSSVTLTSSDICAITISQLGEQPRRNINRPAALRLTCILFVLEIVDAWSIQVSKMEHESTVQIIVIYSKHPESRQECPLQPNKK